MANVFDLILNDQGQLKEYDQIIEILKSNKEPLDFTLLHHGQSIWDYLFKKRNSEDSILDLSCFCELLEFLIIDLKVPIDNVDVRNLSGSDQLLFLNLQFLRLVATSTLEEICSFL